MNNNMTILIRAGKPEGATTIPQGSTLKRVEAHDTIISDDIVSSARKHAAGKQKVCVICGKEFIARQSNYKTCGTENCKYEYKMSQTKVYRQINSDRTNELNRMSYERNKDKVSNRISEYRKNNLVKKCSQQKVHNAIVKGKIKRNTNCELCGSDKNIIAHHQDYLKPLDVNWLCKKCHIAIHKSVNTVIQLATV